MSKLPLLCLAFTGSITTSPAAVDFATQIRPMLARACVGCHGPKYSAGMFRLDVRDEAFREMQGVKRIIPGNVAESQVVKRSRRPTGSEDKKIPRNLCAQLTAEETALLAAWIDEGAAWPENVVVDMPGPVVKDRHPDTIELVSRIRDRILKESGNLAEASMREYTAEIPKTGARYTMVPIKSGEFLLGSPETEVRRGKDEGPQVKVALDAFWMGKYEVTWDEFMPFMYTATERWKDGMAKVFKPEDSDADLVSAPTQPYTDMTWGMGQDGFPAVSMTQHAALKYCQWLSAQTGHFYRLPTEAEWEYACRAGTTTAYSFGDDASQLDDYAWHFENSQNAEQDVVSHQVGLKKPNPWGLHDMHGNVAEWVLDRHDAAGYGRFGASATNPVALPTQKWGQVVRGGSWEDEVWQLRSASRRESEESWQQSDPQIPKSYWYLTEPKWVGFRLVRPLKVPSAEDMHRIWNAGNPAPPK